MKHLVSLAVVVALAGVGPAIAADTKPAAPAPAAEKTGKPAPKAKAKTSAKKAAAAKTVKGDQRHNPDPTGANQ